LTSEEVVGMSRRRAFRNAGFVSTRIAGTDGVSLEIEKWAAVLERNRFECFYFSGENDRQPDKCMLVEEAHFLHPEILEITDACFGARTRPWEISRKIHHLRYYFKQKLHEFVKQFEIDFLIPENVLAIPLNIPLGLALVEFIAENGFPTVAHHHDFPWERTRFLVNAVEDYLQFAFPPNLPSVQHAVINSLASQQLSYRKGVTNTLIPNVYDFASPPSPGIDCSADLRQQVGLGEDDLFVLQPTRIVPRKWIERGLEIVSLMKLKTPRLIVSHSAEDEGAIYNKRIEEYARNLGVELISIEHLVGQKGASGSDNQGLFSIEDVYRCADLISYPSGYEGFGNAFLEAIYYRKPIVVNRYSIYIADIEPKGFEVIPIQGFVTKETIDRIYEVLNNDKHLEEMVEKNYELGARHFSYEVLERLLMNLVTILELQVGD
jgi:glycosyltransferase involved in cell wall biosynthesis